MKYNKLVRDNIPAIIEASGKKCIYKKVEGEEYNSYLKRKLLEEVNEFLNASTIEERQEEMVDITGILVNLCRVYNLDPSKLYALDIKKRLEKGDFLKGFVLLEVANEC